MKQVGWGMSGLVAALLGGCASVDHRAIPVTEAGRPVSEASPGYQATAPIASRAQAQAQAQAQPLRQQAQASAAQTYAAASPSVAPVTVMVPQAAGQAPLQVLSTDGASTESTDATVTWTPPSASTIRENASTTLNTAAASVSQSASNAVSSASTTATAAMPTLAEDEQLDGPVLALLTSARERQAAQDYSGAASSLERAQRIAPREPQVLYQLALVRLEQGDAAQAEQLSRRALTYAGSRPALQARLWEVIAQAREQQGDATGAAAARAQAVGNG